MTLDASGNLGIGTSSPARKLDVVGAIRSAGVSNPYVEVNNGTSSGFFELRGSSNDLNIEVTGANSLLIRTNNALQATINSAGNLGLGVTPSAWNTFDKVFQVGAGSLVNYASTDNTFVGSNTYYGGSPASFRYITTSQTATLYRMESGAHSWSTAASGTAGNAISFTQAMTLDASGRLGIGTTSPVTTGGSRLEISDSANCLATITCTNDTTSLLDFRTNGTDRLQIQASSNWGANFLVRSNQAMLFGTNNTERARIDSSGNLGIGTSSPAVTLSVNGTIGIFGGSLNGSIGSPQLYRPASDTLAIATGAVERMRIDSSGDLLVGQTTSGVVNINGIWITGSAGGQAINHVNGTGSGSVYMYYGYNATTIGSITQSGTTAVLYNLTSDQRLKENIADAASASSLIDAIQVRQFDWKSDASHQRYGFVAQELVTVAPEAVYQPNDPKEMMAVDYSKLVPLLVKEVQSLRARVAQLESKP